MTNNSPELNKQVSDCHQAKITYEWDDFSREALMQCGKCFQPCGVYEAAPSHQQEAAGKEVSNDPLYNPLLIKPALETFERFLDGREPQKPAGKFCANPNCDGDFPIVQGGHMHPGTTADFKVQPQEAAGKAEVVNNKFKDIPCSCPAYNYAGDCSHIEALNAIWDEAYAAGFKAACDAEVRRDQWARKKLTNEDSYFCPTCFAYLYDCNNGLMSVVECEKKIQEHGDQLVAERLKNGAKLNYAKHPYST